MSASIRWQPITEEQGHAIRSAFPELVVFAACTDTNGRFGSPSITDEWGLRGADYAMLKAISKYQRREDFEPGQDYPKRLSTQYYIALVQAVDE
jgi:hypothetical protein